MEKFKELMSWVLTIVFAIVLALVVRQFVFSVVRVEQTSMYPTLKPNDRLIASKISYDFGKTPKRGDIIVIEMDVNLDYVKRVIGVPGDEVYIKNNKVYVNGEKLNEDYLDPNLKYPDYPKIEIPDEKYFVLGDNRPNSTDSRFEEVGLIDLYQVKSKIVFRIYPFNSIGIIK